MSSQFVRSDAFPAGFHDAFGRVVIAFGRIEYLMALIVKRLALKPLTEGVAEALSKRRIDLICDHAKGLYARDPSDEALRRSFDALMDHVKATWNEHRSDLIHAYWNPYGSDAAWSIRPKLLSKGSVSWDRGRRLTPTDLLRLHDELQRIIVLLEPIGREANG